MVGRIFCLWTFTRLHCGNRSCSICSLFCGSYFGSQKRIHYAVIGILFFCLFHAMGTVTHSVLPATSRFASYCSGLPLASHSSCPAAFQSLDTSRLVTARLKSYGMIRWLLSLDSQQNTLCSYIWVGEAASKYLLSTHTAHSSVSSPFLGTASSDKCLNKHATFLPWCFRPRKWGLQGLEEGNWNWKAALTKLPFAEFLKVIIIIWIALRSWKAI
jgi:hypothetical protein